jgi:hypothetical protein
MMKPKEFTKRLEKIYAENLESVILYGSAVGRDFSKRYSDYNTIVVLNDCSPGELAKAQEFVRKWVKKGNPPPLFFDPNHVETSRDVFPLEFIDIRDRHHLLFGKDPFVEINIEKTNLRHQCESELKGKILHMRSFYAENCKKPSHIATFMIQSLPTFVAVFRGVLTMLGVEVPHERAKVVEELSKHIEFNPTVFLNIINVREGNTAAPRRDEALEAFEDYLTALETITSFVDKFEQTVR